MNNLERLIIAEGVQGGVLADYEKRFRRFADVRLSSDDDTTNLLAISDAMYNAFCFLHGEDGPTDSEPYKMFRLARKAMTSHLQIKRLA